MIKRLLLCAILGTAISCGSGSDDDDDTTGTGGTGTAGTETGGGGGESGTRGTYPASGYGVSEGGVLENIEFLNTDGSPFSFEDVYQDAGNKLMLLATTAGWCSSCIEEQPVLQEFHEDYGPDGLFVMVSIFETAVHEPADETTAADWKNQHDLTIKVVADPEFKLEAYYDSSLTPMNMVVEVDTMKILKLTTGFDASAIRAIIEAKL
jgi:thiol-disulfide isomerase/thioredoxin